MAADGILEWAGHILRVDFKALRSTHRLLSSVHHALQSIVSPEGGSAPPEGKTQTLTSIAHNIACDKHMHKKQRIRNWI